MFTGTFTAIVTPFKSGKLDEEALRSLLRKQIDAGVDGIVPVGTTGESPTLNCEEHLRVIELAVESAAGKVKILAGTGGNATEEAIYLTREAKKRGADGSLQVAPYYNKPSQEGLYQHFKAIAEAVDLPIILYSIPGRCGVAIDIGTVKRLSDSCSNVIGIKEAGGDADRVSQLRHALGNDFTILSGDDGLTLPFMSVGAQGVISVASNIIPGPIASMVRDFAGGRTSDALATHAQYYDLFKALFIETNPVPVK
jgi:4-hydroxy-tetrahydrodipicolinate synthase